MFRGIKRHFGTIGTIETVVTGLMAVVPAFRAAACPPRYTMEVFDGADCSPGNTSVIYPSAINAGGVIVGGYKPCPLANEKAFKWGGGPVITLLPFPLGVSASAAYDIADDGAIVGDYAQGGGGGGFLRIGPSFLPLGLPKGANYANPYGVNSAHTIVGSAGHSVTGLAIAFRWIDGKFEDLTPLLIPPHSGAYAMSESGFITGVTGTFEGNPGSMAFLLQGDQATILDVPKGAYAATGLGISENGIVCGEAYYPAPGSPPWVKRGIVWKDETWTNVGLLSGDVSSMLTSVNASGDAVGLSDDLQLSNGVLWHQGVLYDVRDLIDMSEPTNPPGILLQAYTLAINDAGQIAASINLLQVDGPQLSLGARLNPAHARNGDTDCNYVVDIDDLLNVISAWGPCAPDETCGNDLNLDKTVNVEDLMIVLKDWDF